MPIRFRVDPRGFAVFTYEDPYDFQEFSAAVESAIADASYRSGMPILSDRRTASPPPSSFVRQMVRLFERKHAATRGTTVALVVNGSAAYGMGRMQEALADSVGHVVRTFTDYDEAVRWLLTRQLG